MRPVGRKNVNAPIAILSKATLTGKLKLQLKTIPLGDQSRANYIMRNWSICKFEIFSKFGFSKFCDIRWPLTKSQPTISRGLENLLKNKIHFRHLKNCKPIEHEEDVFSNRGFLRKFKLRLSRPSSGYSTTTIKNVLCAIINHSWLVATLLRNHAKEKFTCILFATIFGPNNFSFHQNHG